LHSLPDIGQVAHVRRQLGCEQYNAVTPLTHLMLLHIRPQYTWCWWGDRDNVVAYSQLKRATEKRREACV
jgi:hypothetical protein